MPSPCLRRFAFALLAAPCLASPVLAQSPENEIPDHVDQDGLRPHHEYAIPEVPEATLASLRVEERFFTWTPGVSLLYDWNGIDQDEATADDVGRTDDTGEWRSIRFSNRGRIGHSGKLTYLVSFEYKGFGNEAGERNWAWTDLQLKYDFGGAGTLSVGKVKQTAIYEMVGDSANLPHQERVMSPFFQSRSVGATWSRGWGEGRGTMSAGVYDDAWAQHGDVDLDERGVQATARVTGLAWWRDEGQRFLHLGASLRRVEDNAGNLRFSGRPASNVLPNYVDTGSFAADHATILGLEALWNRGPVSLLAEWATMQVDAGAVGDPRFSGWYLTGSWVVTGETRPYDRKVGYARRVLPQGHWGALEVIGRVGATDLSDGAIDGGGFRIATLGLNWWATRRLKAGLHWTRTDLDGPGQDGRTDALQTPLQWIY